MLKQSILAASLAAFGASGVYASTVVVSGSAGSGAASKATSGILASALGTDASDVLTFAGGTDEIVFTVQGAVADAYANSLKHIDVVISNGVISPASSLSVAWGGVSMTSATTAEFTFPTASSIRIATTVSTAVDSIRSGSTLTLGGLRLLPVEVASGSTVGATVTAVSEVADGTIDSATGKLATYINEFYASVASKFDAQIDVAEDREAYDGVAFDLASVSFTDLEADQHDVGGVAVVFTYSGDFAFLDNDGDGKFGESGEGALAASGGPALTFNASAASGAGSTTTSGTVASFIKVTPSTAATANVIPPQTFTAAVVASYTDGAAETAKATFPLVLGSWTLNAASISIPYLPFGSAYAHSIAVTNPNTASGEIAITLVGNGKTVTESLDVVAAGKTTTEIGAIVGAIAAENGITAASLLVVVNATNVTVKGLYYAKADGDRVLMN